MSRISDALRKAEEEKLDAAQDTRLSPLRGEHDLATTENPGQSPVIPMEGAGLRAAGFGQLTHTQARLLEFVELIPASPWDPDRNSLMFVDGDKGMPGSEQFRTFRYRLNTLREKQKIRRLVITSAIQGDGKTFVAANLAHAFSWQKERRVLLIDGDLRASRLHSLLGASASPGLSDYLAGDADEFAILARGKWRNLFLIPTGSETSNPNELLGNGRLAELLELVSPVFDWVIIDSPPVVPVSDAKVIAESCDGALIVVRAGQTPPDLAQKAYREFKGKPFVGAILNHIEPGSVYGYSYYQQYESKSGQKSRNGTHHKS
jgi:protein-tyrosine kinase